MYNQICDLLKIMHFSLFFITSRWKIVTDALLPLYASLRIKANRNIWRKNADKLMKLNCVYLFEALENRQFGYFVYLFLKAIRSQKLKGTNTIRIMFAHFYLTSHSKCYTNRVVKCHDKKKWKQTRVDNLFHRYSFIQSQTIQKNGEKSIQIDMFCICSSKYHGKNWMSQWLLTRSLS